MIGYARMVRGNLEEGEGPLEAGELVKLRSGGRVMTVGEVRENGEVSCVWMGRGGELQANVFSAGMLRRRRVWYRRFI